MNYLFSNGTESYIYVTCSIFSKFESLNYYYYSCFRIEMDRLTVRRTAQTVPYKCSLQ